MHEKFILSIDAGTSGIRAVLYDHTSREIAYSYREFTQITPAPGLLEQDPLEILQVTIDLINETLIHKAGITIHNVAAIGIATQRATVVAWNKTTGKPIYNAIVWQDLRTSKRCEELSQILGMPISPTSSVTKYEWLLEHLPNCREQVQSGDVLIGTLDSWLVWHLTGGKVFVTDTSNAAPTGMWDPATGAWSPELTEQIGMPISRMAAIMPSSMVYGETSAALFGAEIPVSAVAGDQQAAMFGHLCTDVGDAKATYGTSVMVNINTGNKWVDSEGCYSLALWRFGDDDYFCLEGMVITGGASVGWLKDISLLESGEECMMLAESVPDSGGVFFIPALQGLGTPYMDLGTKGAFLGLTRFTTRAHIARAVLEGIAFRTRQVAEVLRENSPVRELPTLRVDGGMAASEFFLQLQADVLGIKVERPSTNQVTALGVAYMAGLAVGYWSSIEEIRNFRLPGKVFTPSADHHAIQARYREWIKMVDNVLRGSN